MAENIYRIVFTGEIMKGHDLEDVKQELARIFRWHMDKVEELFSVSPIVIAENIDFQKAIKYNTPFKKAGAICKIYYLKNGLQNEIKYPPSQSSSLQQSIIKESPVYIQSQEELKKQKEWLYTFFSDSYERAKEKGGIRKSKQMTYTVIGLFFLLSFVLAAIQGYYMTGLVIGLFNTIVVGILMVMINKKTHKNNAFNIALYFKEYISIDSQKNLPLFLAALFLWAENIQERDYTKGEILSLCDEQSLLNTQEQDLFKMYLKDLKNLDEQGIGKSEKTVSNQKIGNDRKEKKGVPINQKIPTESYNRPIDKSYMSEGIELH